MTFAEQERPVKHRSAESPARIGFLCHAYHRGGVTRWMVDAACEFAQRGVETWFVAPHPRQPFVSGRGRPTVLSLIHDSGAIDDYRLAAPRVGTSFELGTSGFRTSVYAGAVISNVPAGTPIIVSDDEDVWAAAARISGAYPMVGVLHADDPKYYRLARTYVSHLAACAAVSKRIARRAERDTGLAVAAVPCGVPQRFASEVTEANCDRRRLIWVGRLEERQKRVSELPAIAASLREMGVTFSLEVIGDGPQRTWLKTEIKRRGLEEQVQLCGWLSSDVIGERMRESDVLILPSNYEGMPVVVMEALAAGCAVVASRVSGVEDIPEDEIAREVVFIHEIGATSAAAKLVIRALALPCKRRRQLASLAAKRLFDIGICVDRYTEIISQLRPKTRRVPQTTISDGLNALISVPLAYARSARRRLLLGRRRAADS